MEDGAPYDRPVAHWPERAPQALPPGWGKGHNANDKSLPGSSALCAGSFANPSETHRVFGSNIKGGAKIEKNINQDGGWNSS